MAINVNLYGANENITGATAATSALTSLADYVAVNTTAYTINRTPVVDADPDNFIGNVKIGGGSVKFEMEVALNKKSYSSNMTAKTDVEQFPEINFLNKKYHWIYSDNYKVGFTTDTAIKVCITSVRYERQGRYVRAILTLEDSYIS